VSGIFDIDGSKYPELFIVVSTFKPGEVSGYNLEVFASDEISVEEGGQLPAIPESDDEDEPAPKEKKKKRKKTSKK